MHIASRLQSRPNRSRPARRSSTVHHKGEAGAHAPGHRTRWTACGTTKHAMVRCSRPTLPSARPPLRESPPQTYSSTVAAITDRTTVAATRAQPPVISPADHTRIASSHNTVINRLPGHWSVGPTAALPVLDPTTTACGPRCGTEGDGEIHPL